MALSKGIAKCLGCDQAFTAGYPSGTRIGNYPNVKGFLHHGCNITTQDDDLPVDAICEGYDEE